MHITLFDRTATCGTVTRYRMGKVWHMGHGYKGVGKVFVLITYMHGSVFNIKRVGRHFEAKKGAQDS